jgi:hypothetical protein
MMIEIRDAFSVLLVVGKAGQRTANIRGVLSKAAEPSAVIDNGKGNAKSGEWLRATHFAVLLSSISGRTGPMTGK